MRCITLPPGLSVFQTALSECGTFNLWALRYLGIGGCCLAPFITCRFVVMNCIEKGGFLNYFKTRGSLGPEVYYIECLSSSLLSSI